MDARERTEILVAKILSRLAENGTNRILIEISTVDPNGDLDIDKREFIDVLDWLEEEDLIRSGPGWIGLVGRDRCVLTALGFSVLGQPFGPEGLTGTVADVAGKIDSENRIDHSQWGDLLGGLLGGFTKSISS